MKLICMILGKIRTATEPIPGDKKWAFCVNLERRIWSRIPLLGTCGNRFHAELFHDWGHDVRVLCYPRVLAHLSVSGFHSSYITHVSGATVLQSSYGCRSGFVGGVQVNLLYDPCRRFLRI